MTDDIASRNSGTTCRGDECRDAPSQPGPICERGCTSYADCGGLCHPGPPWLQDMPPSQLYRLLDFANRVQKWSLRVKGDATFGRAAKRFCVPVERISQAVIAHYWMFTLDTDRPLAERRIEHEGE